MQIPTLSQTFSEAQANQLVETTWAMIKAVLFGAVLFIAYEFAVGQFQTMWCGFICVQSFLVAWVLYQKRWYVIARYYAFLGASSSVLLILAIFGNESYSFFLLGPLLIGILACFKSAAERFGLSAVVLILAYVVVRYGVLNTFVEPVNSPEKYQLVFVLLSMIVCYYVIGGFLEVNRDFMVRSKGMTHLLKKQEVALHEEYLKEEVQTGQFQMTNRKLEEEMNQRILMERKLSSSNEQLAQFSFAASHDLKEPLRSISGFIRILQKKIIRIEDPVLEVRTSEVIESAAKMATLLDDLLMFSAAGKYKNTSTPVDLNQVLNACLSKLEPEFQRSIDNFETTTLPIVVAEQKAIGILFTQILKNSILFAEIRRPLEISVSSRGSSNGMVEIRVTDNGSGIDTHLREEVFKLFYKVSNTNMHLGSGVGLAISRKIVHSFGGMMEFISNESQEGVTLVFTLPVLPST